MNKPKLLTALAAMIATLAITATPALAEFEANGTTSQGAQQLAPETIATFNASGVPVECTEVAAGQWHIRNSAGVASKRGPNEGLSGQFTKCVAKAGATVPAIVNHTCELSINQAAGSTKATGSVTSDCSITIPAIAGCTITIPAASNGGPLVIINVNNISGGVNILANVGGIFFRSAAACGTGTGKTGTFKAETIAHLQKVV